jgi:hypothetical protein
MALIQSPIVVREDVDSVEQQPCTTHIESNTFHPLSPTTDHGASV